MLPGQMGLIGQKVPLYAQVGWLVCCVMWHASARVAAVGERQEDLPVVAEGSEQAIMHSGLNNGLLVDVQDQLRAGGRQGKEKVHGGLGMPRSANCSIDTGFNSFLPLFLLVA